MQQLKAKWDLVALAIIAALVTTGWLGAPASWDRSPVSPLPPQIDDRERGLPPRPKPPTPASMPACIPGEPEGQAPWMGRYPLTWDGCQYHVDLAHPIAMVE